MKLNTPFAAFLSILSVLLGIYAMAWSHKDNPEKEHVGERSGDKKILSHWVKALNAKYPNLNHYLKTRKKTE